MSISQSNVKWPIYLSDICSTGGGPEEEELGQQEEAEPLSGRIILHLLNNGQSSTIQILGVDRRAPIELIKKAYRAKVVFIRDASSYDCYGYLQAKEFHPDKHAMAAAEEKVILINWLVAWSTIAGEDGVQDERDSGCALLSLRPRQVSELNFSKSNAPTQEGRIP